ncbi:MAG TPA: NPCBM/NEW2 domain-containing protein [Chthoniobacteraceae bacterium]|jgi:hypothetical protein|nr:NPCBM/NEW2 domain-containing protein [Chthoniobacteraceae bacterium]
MKKWLLTVLCFLVCEPLHAATVRLLNGEVLEGKVDLGPRFVTVTRLVGPPVPVDLAAILEVSMGRVPPGPGNAMPAGVLLTSGTIIVERNLPSLEEPTVTLGQERMQVPTSAIAWLLFGPVAPSKLDAAPAGQPGGLLEGGDFFPGTFVGFKGGRVSLNSVLFGPQSFTPGTQILGVCLREWKPPLPRFVVTTTHGSRFATDDLRFEPGALTVKDSLLGVLRLNLDVVESLRAGPGRYQALAEQKPFKVETRPGADAAATLQIQKAGFGAPDTATIAPNLAVTYSVPPGFTTFLSNVSVPKAADPNYRVAFAVYGDGRPLFRTPLLSVADKPLPLRIDLKGARVVTLRVEPFGTAAGGGEWVAPLLLR